MKLTSKSRTPQRGGVHSTDVDASAAATTAARVLPSSSSSSSATTITTIKAAVRVRPLIEAERHTPGNVEDAAASSGNEVIRVVTAAGKLTRPMESAYTLEVLQPPPPSQAASATTKSARKGRGAGVASFASSDVSALRAKAYAFDYCAGPFTSQEELFAMLDMPAMCEAALSGQVVTVFCFGQTGSGKTYTLSGRTLDGAAAGETVGSPDGPLVSEDGLQYQAAVYVARRLKEMRHAVKKKQKLARADAGASDDTHDGIEGRPTGASIVVAKCSYIELYQEALYDLLQADSPETVRCRWSAVAQSFFVEGSLLVECRNKEDFLAVLREGQRNRQRGSHALNRDSSRSHVVFTIFFDVSDEAEGEKGEKGEDGGVHAGGAMEGGAKRKGRRYGRLVFVDLAGSERLKKSQSTSGAETGSINKSLFTLGHVLELLSTTNASAAAVPTTAEKAAAKPPPPFIPYRSSILTQLLMHSLDGHGRTLMVACVSPSVLHLEESLRTLHYAQRARRIRTTPVMHVDAETQQRMALERTVAELQRENAMLRRALQLPRAGPLSEEEVHTSLEALLHGTWDSVAPATRESATALSAPAAAAGAKKKWSTAAAVSRSTAPPAASCAEKPPWNSDSAPLHSHSSPPPSPSPSPSPPTANGDGTATVSILALLDALPDTRSIT
ncbi:kinesin-like protein [Leptomonas pyrrhocoris]|uniref:Kinesin-like protein n=1 Tax=Leptomonas pyrrhocoris TaxID=157538 RepID=A0A0N1J559_LEPPY|nr:kinesin-like protein [Leptomonas pyrrhocoris]XP_015662033.1 kinesin-like protein [Leptomonas pyrrhocoris]KPA83593.1 kinesin-like protein [Leptomonas pyrrhocoris]KPA83594.1 kinesin-like protein [Leptomonas pyrrhocoris]|eukprot:XP_015662032.1 kinesin-like protein [Leptomonas pyrrhocoris]